MPEEVKENREVRVLAFGQAAEITGKSEWTVRGITRSGQLIENLCLEFPALSSLPFTLALNRKVIREDKDLQPGDVVAILPPFSGG